MNYKIFRKKEQGVVLLTCLIFLLVLLLMLRFVIVSARVEEQKAGIDLDIATARESAQSALRFVELYVSEQGKAYCEKVIGEDVATCEKNPLAYANLLFSLDDTSLAAVTSGVSGMPNVKDVHNQGIYTGTFLAGNAAGCDPVWICVDWPVYARSVRTSAEKQRDAAKIGKSAALRFITCPVGACTGAVSSQPLFLIERLTPKEFDPDASGLGDSSIYVNGSKGVVLRVTAVGFGAGEAGANNLTNVVLQSTYVLPNS